MQQHRRTIRGFGVTKTGGDSNNGPMIADPVNSLILDEAELVLNKTAAFEPEAAKLRVLVLDDVAGGLTSGALDRFGATEIRVCCDLLTDELAVRTVTADRAARVEVVDALQPGSLAGAELVLMRLPKSLAALDELSSRIAAEADEQVRLVAGGRVRHMSRSMNDVLARSFAEVSASLGRQKSRVLHAASPLGAEIGWPRHEADPDLPFQVWAHGAAFAGTRLDHGTRLLLRQLHRLPEAHQIIDLGCGTGILATSLARRRPCQVLAIDISTAACHSTRATAFGAGVQDQVTVQRTSCLAGVPPGSADLIVCNLPFHAGTAKDSSPAIEMIRGAAQVLRPGGEMWTVFNSHLPYRTALRAWVGPTEVQAQDRHYTVTGSQRLG